MSDAADNKDDMYRELNRVTLEHFAQMLKDIGFGKIPDILPPTWHLFFSVRCPSCGTDMHWIATEQETDFLHRHVWCPKLECIQNKRLYTILVTPQNCTVVGSEER